MRCCLPQDPHDIAELFVSALVTQRFRFEHACSLALVPDSRLGRLYREVHFAIPEFDAGPSKLACGAIRATVTLTKRINLSTFWFPLLVYVLWATEQNPMKKNTGSFRVLTARIPNLRIRGMALFFPRTGAGHQSPDFPEGLPPGAKSRQVTERRAPCDVVLVWLAQAGTKGRTT